MTAHLALVAGGAGVIAPRSQMGFSLGWHIILACLGVGLAVLLPSLALLFSLFERPGSWMRRAHEEDPAISRP
jgi:cytochrome bd-type quinol oxidase subunit 1